MPKLFADEFVVTDRADPSKRWVLDLTGLPTSTTRTSAPPGADGTIATTGGAPSAHASTHLPGGSDPLTTAAPGASASGDSAAAGSAASFSRSDHVHAREWVASTSTTPSGTQSLPASARAEVVSDDALVIASGDYASLASGALLNLRLGSEQLFPGYFRTVNLDTTLMPGSTVQFEDDPLVIASSVKVEVPLDTVLWTDAARCPQTVSTLLIIAP